jgi:phosphatidylethanolamine-binding protein (PEBP) family uncharacterized protein
MNQPALKTRGVFVMAGVLVGALKLFGCSSGGSSHGTGSAGKTGTAGMTGTAGTTGAAGTMATAGMTGTAGTTATAGTMGTAGTGGAAGTGAAGAGAAGTGAAGASVAGTTGAAGSASDGGAGAAGPDAGANTDAGAFTLMSATLKMVDGGLVFPASASAPMNQSPELRWSGAPAGRLSFALTIYDASAKNTHFVLYDIKPDEPLLMANLPRGAMPAMPAGASWKSAFGGTPGYEGPGGGGINNYEIVLWALKVAKLDVGTMTLNQIHMTVLPAQSLGSAQILAKGTRNGL